MFVKPRFDVRFAGDLASADTIIAPSVESAVESYIEIHEGPDLLTLLNALNRINIEVRCHGSDVWTLRQVQVDWVMHVALLPETS